MSRGCCLLSWYDCSIGSQDRLSLPSIHDFVRAEVVVLFFFIIGDAPEGYNLRWGWFGNGQEGELLTWPFLLDWTWAGLGIGIWCFSPMLLAFPATFFWVFHKSARIPFRGIKSAKDGPYGGTGKASFSGCVRRVPLSVPIEIGKAEGRLYSSTFSLWLPPYGFF